MMMMMMMNFKVHLDQCNTNSDVVVAFRSWLSAPLCRNLSAPPCSLCPGAHRGHVFPQWSVASCLLAASTSSHSCRKQCIDLQSGTPTHTLAWEPEPAWLCAPLRKQVWFMTLHKQRDLACMSQRGPSAGASVGHCVTGCHVSGPRERTPGVNTRWRWSGCPGHHKINVQLWNSVCSHLVYY